MPSRVPLVSAPPSSATAAPGTAARLTWAAGQVAGGWRDGGTAVAPRTRPQRRESVDGGGHGAGSLLVVDPPADEIRPRIGGLTLATASLAHRRRRSQDPDDVDSGQGPGGLGADALVPIADNAMPQSPSCAATDVSSLSATWPYNASRHITHHRGANALICGDVRPSGVACCPVDPTRTAGGSMVKDGVASSILAGAPPPG